MLVQLRAAVSFEMNSDDTTDPAVLAQNAREMAAMFHYLDEWITNGGFLPSQWSKLGPRRTSNPPKNGDAG